MKTADEVIAEADQLATGFDNGAIVMLKVGRFNRFCLYSFPGNQFRDLKFLELRHAMEEGLTPVGILLSRSIARKTQIVVRPLDEWSADRWVALVLKDVSQTLARHEARDQGYVGDNERKENNFTE